MTLEEIKDKKRQMGYSYARLSRESGVPVGTIQKIFNGETRNPRYETIQLLGNALGLEEQSVMNSPLYGASQGIQRPLRAVHEPQAAYNVRGGEYDGSSEKKQGQLTVRDYEELPDDQRYELIDGVLYMMASPSTYHQVIAAYLYTEFLTFIRSQNGTCLPFMSPLDVQLDMDDRTVVQPDVMIVCNPETKVVPHIYGAPDFIAEVLSPSTAHKDFWVKMRKYQEAGVREYWMISPEDERVMTFDFEHGGTGRMYTFEEKVPVVIYEGKVEMDFPELKRQLNALRKRDGIS